MKVLCKSCCNFFETADANVGSTDFCPHCGAEVFIQDRALAARNAAAKRKLAAVANVSAQPECSAGLCFCLGLFLNLLGLLIAAIIGKQRGVVCALWGLLVAFACGVVFAIIFSLL